jgi:hypothetical protein
MDAERTGGSVEQAERIAWAVLADLCRPGGEFATYPPRQLEELIALRLAREADEHSVPPDTLAAAFGRALREFTGADRPARDAAAPLPDEPMETVDDL